MTPQRATEPDVKPPTRRGVTGVRSPRGCTRLCPKLPIRGVSISSAVSRSSRLRASAALRMPLARSELPPKCPPVGPRVTSAGAYGTLMTNVTWGSGCGGATGERLVGGLVECGQGTTLLESRGTGGPRVRGRWLTSGAEALAGSGRPRHWRGASRVGLCAGLAPLSRAGVVEPAAGSRGICACEPDQLGPAQQSPRLLLRAES